MVTVPPQLSVAVAVPALAGVVAAPHARVMAGGQVITGTVLSATVTVNEHVLLLPVASVNV